MSMLMIFNSSSQDAFGVIFTGLLRCFYTFSLSSLVFTGLLLQVMPIMYGVF